VLNETLALENCNLRELWAHLHTHQIPTNGLAIAFFAAPTLDQFGICSHDGLRRTLARRLAGTAALSAASTLFALTCRLI
jgi:hypothetical protein